MSLEQLVPLIDFAGTVVVIWLFSRVSLTLLERGMEMMSEAKERDMERLKLIIELVSKCDCHQSDT